jgi:hypothetical protein
MIYWFENHSNVIQYNLTHVFLSSSISNDKHGLHVNKVNFRESISLYTNRRLIINTWRNNADVYIANKEIIE